VPVEITVQLIENAMKRSKWEGGNFLIDGFPRSFDNLRGWQEVLGDSVNVRSCLYFDCSEAVMEARLLERGKTSGRIDDNLKSIKKRFRTFQEESMPVVQYLEGLDLVQRINSERSVDDVWASVRRLLEDLSVPVNGSAAQARGELQLTTFSQVVAAKRARRGQNMEDGMLEATPIQRGLGASASVPSRGDASGRRPRVQESPWETSYRRQYQQPPSRRFYYDGSRCGGGTAAGGTYQRPLTLEPAAASYEQLPATAQFNTNPVNIASPGAAWQPSPATRLGQKTAKTVTSQERLKLQAELAMFSTGQLRTALRFAGNNVVSS